MNDMEQSMIRAGFAASSIEAQQIVNFLKENRITAYSRGGVLHVYEGNSTSGFDIYVGREDLERAQELLRSFTPVSTYSCTQSGERSKTTRVILRILAILVILMVVLPVLFVLIGR